MSRMDGEDRLAAPHPGQAAGDAPPVLASLPADHAAPAGRPDLAVALLEAGLLSAGVFGLLEALRRRQQQHRPSGRRIRLPSGAVMETELALRLGQRPERGEQIQRALRALAAAAAGSSESRLPPVLGLLVDEDAVELLLGRPSEPPPPLGRDPRRIRLAA